MREKFIYWAFRNSQKTYLKYTDRKPWVVTKEELINYPPESFGYHLGKYLLENNFELLPKAERHDAYHLITGYGNKVEDEIALQFVCFGNGKKSIYMLSAMIIGFLVFPEHLNYYIDSYKLGRNSNPFHQFKYQNLLNYTLIELREIIFNKQQILNIQ